MTWILDPLAYLPALLLITAAAAVPQVRNNGRILAAFTVINIIAIAITVGWIAAIVSTAVAGLLFVLFVFSGIMTKSSTFVIPALIASLAPMGWLALLPGFIAAAVWSAAGLRRSGGAYFVGMLAGETARSLGVGQLLNGGLPTKPDLAALPVDMGTESTRRVKTPLLAMLAGGVALFMITSLVLQAS